MQYRGLSVKIQETSKKCRAILSTYNCLIRYSYSKLIFKPIRRPLDHADFFCYTCNIYQHLLRRHTQYSRNVKITIRDNRISLKIPKYGQSNAPKVTPPDRVQTSNFLDTSPFIFNSFHFQHKIDQSKAQLSSWIMMQAVYSYILCINNNLTYRKSFIQPPVSVFMI